jgi:hypothetical protein
LEETPCDFILPFFLFFLAKDERISELFASGIAIFALSRISYDFLKVFFG